jgi:hypothetical protein
MKKIISISVWGDSPRYIVGANRQYNLAKKYYPDWEFRIYTDNKTKFSNLKDANIIEVTDDSYGMFWRFRAMFEDTNNIVLVRDSDSRISLREQMAVNEWLESDKKFHTFRDHEAHYEFPIIGCAFGYKGKFKEDTTALLNKYTNDLNYYLGDQIFLRDVIWPLVKDSALVHSMDNGWFGETRNQLENPYDFCGNGYDEYDMPLYPPTLAECTGFDPKLVEEKYKFNYGNLLKEKL